MFLTTRCAKAAGSLRRQCYRDPLSRIPSGLPGSPLSASSVRPGPDEQCAALTPQDGNRPQPLAAVPSKSAPPQVSPARLAAWFRPTQAARLHFSPWPPRTGQAASSRGLQRAQDPLSSVQSGLRSSPSRPFRLPRSATVDCPRVRLRTRG
ncbi:hypothetical protein NDU88_005316 [Pleurodeles waltl]|uniref:Uncharacterized protein n=1 Tax=Pleurodeles waltl TaxID=8319 RepID=A0AAV7LNV2_PLEWA|nr:hypothetical protein NDU88_005316 [Pleurodeles waltl]